MDGLTLDVDDDLLYWTDVTYQNIQRADLDGGNRRTILKGLDKPRAIVLYKARRLVTLLFCSCGTIYVPIHDVYLSQARLPIVVREHEPALPHPRGRQIKPEWTFSAIRRPF